MDNTDFEHKQFMRNWANSYVNNNVLAATDTTELDTDPDLMLKPDEPEAWNVTADKKILKKMSKKDIKRQDNIYGREVLHFQGVMYLNNWC